MDKTHIRRDYNFYILTAISQPRLVFFFNIVVFFFSMTSSSHHCTLIHLFLLLGEVKALNKNTLMFIRGQLNLEFEDNETILDRTALITG